jgi:hypothetical protein|tara:strand:- start:8 stop:502 length:495 start_codon:yes stop_codon:yes gene_type:complete
VEKFCPHNRGDIMPDDHVDICRTVCLAKTGLECSEGALSKALFIRASSTPFRKEFDVRTKRVCDGRSNLGWKRSAQITALISGPDTRPSLTRLFAIFALRCDGQINKADHDAGRAVPSMLPIFSACSDSRRRGEFIEHPLDASALGCTSVCPLCALISVIRGCT